MITSLQIENFKCLRNVQVDLKPFTVLVGKNDTGKSSLLEAMSLLADLVKEASPELKVPVDKLVFRGADPAILGWKAEISPSPRNRLPQKGTYHLRISQAADPKFAIYIEEESLRIEPDIAAGYLGSHTDPRNLFVQDGTQGQREQADMPHSTALSTVYMRQGFGRLKAAVHALSDVARYRLDPSRLAEDSAYPVDRHHPDANPKLAHDGYGLPTVLDLLLGTNRSAFAEIERELHDAVPLVKTIQLTPSTISTANGNPPRMGKAVSFQLNPGGHSIPARLASDGVLLYLAYLTLVHSPNPPALLLLEEPENGIHPAQLGRIADYLQRLTDPNRNAKTVQIVIATHSPYLLDFVPPDSVLVFGRKSNGESVVAPLLTLPGVQKRLESGFSLGEMWYNVGEDKLLEEVLK